MQTLATEAIIPQYAFEPDPEVNNSLFRIVKAKCNININMADFLIPHRKDYYFLAFVQEGSSRHWIDMTPYTVKPNHFYFTIPHQVHLKEEVALFTGYSLAFTEEFLGIEENGSLRHLPIIQNRQNGHELTLTAADLIFVEDLIEKIYAEFNSNSNWQQNMLMAYMKVLLIYLSRLYTQQFPDPESVPDRLLLKKYLTKIEESYTELHEVAAYADMLNISAGHLSDVVKAQSGKPAIAHIQARLILEAKRLLFHKDQSVKEVAYALGFEDASYFNRFFKRITSQTPVDYRNTIREMYH